MGDRDNSRKDSEVQPQRPPTEEATNQSSQRYLEYLKIEYDLLKHLLTLGVAAIAAFGGLFGVFLSNQKLKPGTLPLGDLRACVNR
jgi:hypothetical protein